MIPILFLGLAVADNPNTRIAKKVTAALERTGPHMARFAKEVDGQPEETVLEVFYYADDDVALRIFGGGVEAVFAVDDTHARIRVSEQCAVVPLEPMLQTVASANTSASPQDSLRAMLDYRLTPGGEVDMNILFQQTDMATPFGWLADIGDEDATVSKEGPLWRSEKEGIQWWVSRKTGVLERMVVADENGGPPYTVAQVDFEPISAQAQDEIRACQTSSDDLATAMFTAQLLWEAHGRTLPTRLEEWAALDPTRREQAVQQQRLFWRQYFASETETWANAMQNNQIWATQIIAGIGDIQSFEAFEARLPPEQHEESLHAWLELWFTTTGQSMLDEYVQSTEQRLYQRLAADGVQIADPSIIATYVVQPMVQEARLAGEEAIVPVLRSVIERGEALIEARIHRH